MAFTILVILSVVAVAASVIPFLRTEGWWVRGFDFPRLQFAFLASVLLLATVILLDESEPRTWALVAAATFCLCVQGWWILPYTRLFPVVEVGSSSNEEREHSIRIMTANVLQPNRRADALLEIVRERQPDVLVALEANQWWQDQLDALEREDGYRYTIKCPLENLYGMLVYSKLPLENAKMQYLVQDEIPSMHTLAVLPSGQKIRIHFVHPAPPSPSENQESSERDAELMMVGRSAARTSTPVIVTGDLNDVAWSATTRLFRKTSKLLDPRIGRGMYNTYNAKHWFLRWPLDHLFCSRHFLLKEIVRLPKFGSDHFPMLMELVCYPQQVEGDDSPDIDDDDRQRVEDKMDDEDVEPSDVHEPDRD